MSQTELLKRTVAALDRLGIPFMLTGSLASSVQGEPRSTHDIDVVVELTLAQIDDLIVEFPAPDFYLSRTAMEQAIRQRTMFNLLDVREGDKVDFWLLTGDAFDQSRFARRALVDYDGVKLWISAPEDTILMKLRWSRDAGGSQRQHHDALRVYEMQHTALDTNYLEWWIDRLDLRSDWQRLLADASASK